MSAGTTNPGVPPGAPGPGATAPDPFGVFNEVVGQQVDAFNAQQEQFAEEMKRQHAPVQETYDRLLQSLGGGRKNQKAYQVPPELIPIVKVLQEKQDLLNLVTTLAAFPQLVLPVSQLVLRIQHNMEAHLQEEVADLFKAGSAAPPVQARRSK